jgi:hypothetical protein
MISVEFVDGNDATCIGFTDAVLVKLMAALGTFIGVCTAPILKP